MGLRQHVTTRAGLHEPDGDTGSARDTLIDSVADFRIGLRPQMSESGNSALPLGEGSRLSAGL
eukprot:8603853-Alexandrium_andersonii.AAC.1